MKTEMTEKVALHGEKIKAIFGIDADVNPITLCRRLRRLELRAHNYAEALNNGTVDPSEEEDESFEETILGELDVILDFRHSGIPVVFNRDSRGYALKIGIEYTGKHMLNIPTDWGGFGLIAPDLRTCPG